MRVGILVNEVAGGWSPLDFDDFLRGGEEAVCHMALELKRNGYDVAVFQNGWSGAWRGVSFVPRAAASDEDAECWIVRKCPEEAATVRGRKVLWTDQVRPFDPAGFEQVIVASPYLRERLREVVPGLEQIDIIPDGYDEELMRQPVNTPRSPGLCLYASSPDRGLAVLEREVWPRVQEACPEARLVTTYGMLKRREMYALYRQADLLLYPCTGGEYYCNTVVRAQVGGCVPVVIPWGALRDTARFGVTVRGPQELAAAAIDMLHHRELLERKRRYMMEQAVRAFPTWREAGERWCGEVLAA